MAKRAQFDDAEFARTLERVAADQDAADWSNPKPKLDPQVHRDVRDEALRGRKIGDFHQALRACGMRWIPKERLGFWQDGTPHREGMWVHPDPDMHVAFTEDDIVMYFPAGPEEFWGWISKKAEKLAWQRAGLVPPS